MSRQFDGYSPTRAGPPVDSVGPSDLIKQTWADGELRQVLELAPDAMVIINDHGQIALVNAQTERLFGYDRHELLGQRVEILMPDRFRCRHREYLVDYFANPCARAMGSSLEIYGLSKEGTEFPAEISLSPMQTAEGVLVTVVIRDVTDKKQAAGAVNEAQMLAEAIVETVRESLLILDDNLYVQSANHSFYQTFETTPQDTENHLVYELGNCQWDIPRLRHLLEQVLPDMSQFNDFEVQHSFEHIGQRTMLLNARKLEREGERPSLILLAIEDITVRKRAEEALAELASGLALAPRSFDDAKTVIHLSDVSLEDLFFCGAAIRGMSTHVHGKEEFAGKLVQFFHKRFVDEQGYGALPLVRCFETCSYEELDDELKTIADSSSDHPTADMKCMTLVATAGDQQQWNDTRTSVGHRVIPLPSEAAVERRLPMISQLLRQLGLEVGGVIRRDDSILIDFIRTKVFHIHEAKNSPYIPAQNDFVIPFGIRSVIGFGDLQPDGNLFVVIMFSKIPIPRETAILFSHLSLSVRIALLRFAKIDDKIAAQLVAIARLLKNQEEIGAHQESQLRTALAKLSRTNIELERSNRDLQDFAYVVSHDLRAPLVNLQGFSHELVLSCERLRSVQADVQVPEAKRRELSALLEEDIPEALEFITTNATKMDGLLSGVLQLSRVGQAALTIRPLDINQMLSEIVASRQFAIEQAGASVQVDSLPTCQGDEMQFNQVFSNLLDNALKYLDPNRPGVIRVCGQEDPGRVVYSIEDNGIGIAAQYQDSIYKVFHRLDPQRGTGEGLGLSIVRRILDRHSGKIWVESEVNEGSKFYLSLPKG